jgi:hypothetical protein
MTTPELRTEYMRSSPIAAGRIRRLRVNKRLLPIPLGVLTDRPESGGESGASRPEAGVEGFDFAAGERTLSADRLGWSRAVQAPGGGRHNSTQSKDDLA